jgi:predicted methyltransferase
MKICGGFMTLLTNWLELLVSVFTILAIGAFVSLGIVLRRYAANRGRTQLETRSLAVRLWRSTRTHKIRTYQAMASDVIQDVTQLMANNQRVDEARAMRSLVSDARKKGEHLVATRQFYHAYWLRSENALFSTVSQLTLLEERIGALPRSQLTLEDVLAGRFFDKSANRQGA